MFESRSFNYILEVWNDFSSLVYEALGIIIDNKF